MFQHRVSPPHPNTVSFPAEKLPDPKNSVLQDERLVSAQSGDYRTLYGGCSRQETSGRGRLAISPPSSFSTT